MASVAAACPASAMAPWAAPALAAASCWAPSPVASAIMSPPFPAPKKWFEGFGHGVEGEVGDSGKCSGYD